MSNRSKKLLCAVVAAAILVYALPRGIRLLMIPAKPPSGGACGVALLCVSGAKQQWALECHKSTNDVPTWNDLRPYLPGVWSNHWANGIPVCPAGGVYTLGRVGDPPRCSIGGIGHSVPE
jgi:hypothetical protein